MAEKEGKYHPLLNKDDKESINTEPWCISQHHYVYLPTGHSIFLAIGYSLLAVLYFLFARNAFSTQNNAKKQIFNSTFMPLAPFPSLRSADVLQIEYRTWPAKLHGNPFTGNPRPELDKAWHSLFEKSNIRVTKEDLEFHNVSSVTVASTRRAGKEDQNITEEAEGGWIGQLGVFHELHCLKRVRHWVHREYYLADASEAVMIEEEAHVDHCIELLREAILCRADTTLSGLRWVHRGLEDMLTVDASGYHACIDWQILRAWNDERWVEPMGFS